ncbi:MAG TPA: D-alanine--D-alanine ligase family protein [Pyrinomonadaceae bacterium]|nr:D-alanine--D-alanine ligase [Chloracidobacterium sp.]MBP9936946.1 D-alanine--D-alanine ligase [Pyrinomonadaceae bacterium]MBK7803843.1 D-alanine--D-alanine ligase [Chloracidobacterium sp.]MBK9439484.1 D-alanine--D-alanine ligase [Chloracidobacterium sp.]MBL0239227.1 D-alanine--D-alanine ligase [Chloracidobacterium sp.]
MKKTIGVIFGGRSGEHDVSIRSAKTVIEQIDSSRYHVVPVAITNDGRWLSGTESLALFPAITQAKYRERFGEPSKLPISLTGDTKQHGLTTMEIPGGTIPLDVIFPVLHGTYGEDGTIQGLFEMADIPYVGCGVLASSTGMDKVFMKTLFRDAGLPMCNYVWFLRREWETAAEAVVTQVESKIGYPCFVKPANLGSSVGVSMAVDSESLRTAISLAAEYDRKIIVEEGLDMREIECAVLGNDKPEASLPGEYIIRDASKKFLDYTEKYAGTGNNEFIVPSPVSDELVAKIRHYAVAAFKSIDGSGLARVDFFLRNDTGALLVNEINTLPGLTDASGYPKMWAGTGIDFAAVIDRLIVLAIERHADRSRSKTTVN